MITINCMGAKPSQFLIQEFPGAADSQHCPTQMDNECALVVRASSNTDAGGRVAVPAGASRPKRLRLVGHFQRISQATTVPAVPESSREFDMTRGDSSSDTESVQHHVEEDREEDVAGVHPLEIDDGRSDVGSAVSEDVETGDNLEPDPEVREVIVTPMVPLSCGWTKSIWLKCSSSEPQS